MNPGALGVEWKQRSVVEGEEWADSLAEAKIDVKVWDDRLSWVVEHVSVQPLVDSYPFLEENYRILQIHLPNEMVGWIYFRIEPDDEHCTLLWVHVTWFTRLG
jgi:hypothetical protein